MQHLVRLVCLSMMAFSLASQAHTPYLKPLSFEPARGGLVTLDASFAEKFFVPEVAFANSIYSVIQPDGTTTPPDFLSQMKSRVVLEHSMVNDGTYRFSTGRRLGRTFKIYELNGKRESMKDPALPIPAGAKLLSFFQSLTMAETYVSKGAPSREALKAYEEGLEFVVQNHPNELFVGETLELKSLFNGAPLANLAIQVFLAKDQFTDEKPQVETTSAADGSFSFTPTQAGTYLLLARHRSKAPKSSLAPQISNTYTLVIEAVE